MTETTLDVYKRQCNYCAHYFVWRCCFTILRNIFFNRIIANTIYQFTVGYIMPP